MGKSIFKLSANYDYVATQFMPDSSWYVATVTGRKKTIDQIKLDLPRTVYFSRKHSLGEFFSRFTRKGTSTFYTQGDCDARIITSIQMQLQTVNAPNIHKRDVFEKFYQANKDLSFAFIDNNGHNCALSIAYQTGFPEFFIITYIRHTRKDPKYREVLVFQGSDDDYYPNLEKLCGPAYQKGELVEQESLKQQLLAIPSLPTEVRFLIKDVIDNKGQLKTDELNAMGKEMKENSTNHNLLFAGDVPMIKKDLAVYQIFCQQVSEQLSFIEKLPGTDRNHKRQLLQLIESAEKTKDQVELTLKALENSELDAKGLIETYQSLRKNILSYLKEADISQPYQDLLDELDEKYQSVHQSFWDRRKTSLITSTAITVLAIAGLALTATSILAPVGMAIIAAVNITLILASVVSWGLLADKEIEYSADKKYLNTDVKKSIKEAELNKGITKSTLDLYLKNMRDIDFAESDAPRSPQMSCSEQTFFRRALREMGKAEPTAKEEHGYAPVHQHY